MLHTVANIFLASSILVQAIGILLLAKSGGRPLLAQEGLMSLLACATILSASLCDNAHVPDIANILRFLAGLFWFRAFAFTLRKLNIHFR